MKKLNERQKMILLKAIDCLQDVSQYNLAFRTKGYDKWDGKECDFDPLILSLDLGDEFGLDSLDYERDEKGSLINPYNAHKSGTSGYVERNEEGIPQITINPHKQTTKKRGYNY